MYKRLTNNPDAVGTGTGAQNAVTCNTTPFTEGRTVILEFYNNGMSGTPVFTFQGSDDGGTTWVDILTLTTAEALAPHVKKTVQLRKQVRMNKTTAAGGGTWTAYLLAPPI